MYLDCEMKSAEVGRRSERNQKLLGIQADNHSLIEVVGYGMIGVVTE